MVSVETLPAAFRLDQALKAGLSKDQVYKLRNAGVIEVAGRGVYIQTGLVDPSLSALAAASLRQPLATLCLTSALVHHGLSDEIPIQTDIALPRRTRAPARFEHVAWHVFAAETFDVGRDEVTVADINVGIYSPERTVVDVFRLGHLEGTDVAHEALRRWLRKQGSNPSLLLRVAQDFPIAAPQIQHALEVLL